MSVARERQPTRRLIMACTRPPTRCLSYTFNRAGRRVMPSVRLLSYAG